jgi:hypothetical protein
MNCRRCLWFKPPKSKSELLYDWRFTANQFVLASRPLRPTTRFFFSINSCGNRPYVTSSLTRRWVCLLWICLAFRQMYISHIQHVTENSSFLRSTPPFRGPLNCSRCGLHRKHPFKQFLYCCVRTLLSNGSGIVACLHSRCLAMTVYPAPLF